MLHDANCRVKRNVADSQLFTGEPDLAERSAVNSLTMLAMDYRRAREVLRDERHRSEMQVSDLAERAGVDRTTIYRVEKLRRFPDYCPDFGTIEKLCAAMGLSLSELFARIEGQGVPSATGKPHEGSEDEARFADRLAKACLDAATRSRRAHTRALLEDLAVAFGMTDPEQGETTINIVRERREA